jgi:hypothetical protein
MFEVIQGSKRENQSGGWKCQRSRASQGLLPIRRGKEKQEHWYQRYNRQLKDVCSGAFVRLRRLHVPAEHRKQRCE